MVPIIGVWAGFFPLEFSWWFALAFTIYSASAHLLLYYCHDVRHMRSIYFSICAAHVLWFAYAKVGPAGHLSLLDPAQLAGDCLVFDSLLSRLWLA